MLSRPFLGRPINYHSRERNLLFRRFFRCAPKIVQTAGEQQTFLVKSVFFIGDAAIVLPGILLYCRLPRVIFLLLRFREFFALLARNFKLTKTPRQSFLTACDCCLAHPTPSHTPSRASLNFGGALHDFNGGSTRFLVYPGPRGQRVPSGDPMLRR